ncbi:MAG: ral secretion pathway protein [Verrucomicrobiota bacterium]|jgi:general secretion pathway protein F
MKSEELAFASRQLAGMLQSGLPLEGALGQLCADMQRGALRDELKALEADLARGTPFQEALAARRLPAFLVAMLQIGAASNDLPAVLTLLADYYQSTNLLWTRLKGLLVYPVLVLGAALGVSLLVAVIYQRLIGEILGDFHQGMPGRGAPGLLAMTLNLWAPVGVIAILCGAVGLGLAVPKWRRSLRWRIPGFKEARLSQLASALALMLGKGCTFDQALLLLQQLEGAGPAGHELAQWRARSAAGYRKFSEITTGGKLIPPLFVWLVTGTGEDWAGGFRQAAAFYFERARHRIDMMLYAALPVSVLALGFLVLAQVLPIARLFASLMRMMAFDFDAG